jgi:hypothetical protein
MDTIIGTTALQNDRSVAELSLQGISVLPAICIGEWKGIR